MGRIETITINGRRYNVTPDSQGYFTIDLSGSEAESFLLDTTSICDVGAELTDIQINEGSTREDFVSPTENVVTPATGVYEDISNVRLLMENNAENLRNEINITVDGLAERIEKIDTDGTQKLAQTIVDVNGLRQDVTATQDTADGLQQSIHTLESSIDGLRSQITRLSESTENGSSFSEALLEQTADELRSEIKRVEQSIDGLDYVTQSQLQQTADSLQSKITQLQQSADNGESLSETLLQQTADDLRAEIRKVETTANSASSQISSVQMTVDSINRTLKSTTQTANVAQQTASQALQTTEAFQTKLDKIQENVDGGQSFSESLVQQTAEELRTQIKNAQQTANSANQAVSTLTQTVDGIDSKIQSATTSANGYTDQKLSSVNQTINGLSSSVTSLQQTVNGLDYVTQSKLTQTANSLRSEISEAQSTADGANKQISTLTQTAQGLQTSVKDLQQKQESQITQLSNLISQKVSTQDVQSMIQQSEDRIKLQVSQGTPDGETIVSAINLTPDLVRIKGNSIRLDGETIIQDSVIKSSHIESLTADKLTAGTIDASKINVINLNANNISGLTSSFIQSRWNAISSSVEINPDGILSTASNGSQVYIQNGIMGARNPSGASIGQIGYQYDGGSPAYVIKTTMGSHFEIWQTANNGTTYKIIQLENGGQSYYNYASAYYFPIGEATFDHKVTISNGAELRMNEGEIVNPYGISLYHGGRLYTLSGGEATRLDGSRQLQLLVNNTRKMAIDTTRIYMYQDLNMQNHAIAQQSDARFKKNIQDYDYDALSRVDQIKFKTFNWKSSGKKDYGFIAQEVQEFAPEWIIEEPDGSLTYDTLLIAKIALRSAQQLSQKIKELEDEIKTLSGNEP